MTKSNSSEAGMSTTRMLAWLVILGPWWALWPIFWLRSQDFEKSTLVAWFTTTEPVCIAFTFALTFAMLLYVISIPIRNCSIFDAFWSVLPASVYCLLYAFHPMAHPNGLRRIVVIAAVWLWSLRLTGNWLIKGGMAEEDFRYIGYRKKMSPVVFQLFAFFALFVLQAIMVVTMSLPIRVALRTDSRTFGPLDGAAALVVVGAVMLELVADMQSFRFRRQRDARQRSHPEEFSGTPVPGKRFITSGVWHYSRHPNYFGEICAWWGIYLFSVAATGTWINWTIVGPLTINSLFVFGSAQITEVHELSRKPEYTEYQKTTSRIVPWWPTKSLR